VIETFCRGSRIKARTSEAGEEERSKTQLSTCARTGSLIDAERLDCGYYQRLEKDQADGNYRSPCNHRGVAVVKTQEALKNKNNFGGDIGKPARDWFSDGVKGNLGPGSNPKHFGTIWPLK